MYCTNCGNPLPDASSRCPRCGTGQGGLQTGPARPSPNPDNYLVAAVLLSLCWCTPLGLVALVYAGKGSGLLEAGDVVRASEYGAKARMWAWIAFGLGLLVWAGYAAIMLLGALAGASS